MRKASWVIVSLVGTPHALAETSKTTYLTNEKVAITYSNMLGDPTDYLTAVPASDSDSTWSGPCYQRLGSTKSGTGYVRPANQTITVDFSNVYGDFRRLHDDPACRGLPTPRLSACGASRTSNRITISYLPISTAAVTSKSARDCCSRRSTSGVWAASSLHSGLSGKARYRKFCRRCRQPGPSPSRTHPPHRLPRIR